MWQTETTKKSVDMEARVANFELEKLSGSAGVRARTWTANLLGRLETTGETARLLMRSVEGRSRGPPRRRPHRSQLVRVHGSQQRASLALSSTADQGAATVSRYEM